MDNVAFIPRDDIYTKKDDSKQDHVELKSSSGNHQQNQPSDLAPLLIKISKHLVSQINDENKTTQESIETVFEKRRVDEDKTESITDSTFRSVAEKQTLEASFTVTPSKKNLTDSLDTLKSASDVCPTDSSLTSRLSHKRTNVSNVFPVGCMGCKDESEKNNDSRRTIQENIRCSNQNSNQSVPVKDDKEILQESRRQMIKRKDGNPLLGVGYEDSTPTFTTTTCKIPPGGFSHGLW